MKIIVHNALIVSALIICGELFYWGTIDYIIFNESALENGFELLYYCSASIMAILLLVAQTLLRKKKLFYINYLLVILTSIYILFSLGQLWTVYCADFKNLKGFYLILNSAFVVFAIVLLLRNVLLDMNERGWLIISIANFFLVVDLLYLLMGYQIFYPGFW